MPSQGTGNRGLANLALFRARILLDAWAQAQGSRNDTDLNGAFAPAVRLHLLRAYGWFLLAVSGADVQEQPERLPASARDVPAPPEGQARAPELQEFLSLEASGWIGDLHRAGSGTDVGSGVSPVVLGSDRRAAGLGEFEGWLQALTTTMQRMDDSLSEC